MAMLSKFLAALTILFAPLALASCADPKPLYVDQAWVRLSANPDSPSAGYFIVHGGPEPVKLLAVTTPAAQRLELHESIDQNGVMKMQPIVTVDIPAKTDVAFAPGGKHMMLWGINEGMKKEGKLPLTFIFSNGDRILFDAVIQPAGSASPAGSKDDHKTH